MKLFSKNLSRASKLLNITIAFILSVFLISLSSIFIDDISDWEPVPTVSTFYDHDAIKVIEDSIALNQNKIDQLNTTKSTVIKSLNASDRAYQNAKNSFDNWLATREVIQSPQKDQEVITRVKKVDEIFKIQQEWENELVIIEDRINSIVQQKNDYRNQIYQQEEKGAILMDQAIRKHDLKVFFIRLLIVLPILLIAVYFILKFREHKYWPLFLGFILYAFYAFFFGLVPYLPSYGGYIRYSVGIILCITLGIYAMKALKKYIQNKKEKLQVSGAERAQKIELESAEKAYQNKCCPSCSKSYVINRSSNGKNIGIQQLMLSTFCRFCGLELFKKCSTCDHENFAHLPFCSNCGSSTSIGEANSLE